MSCKREQRVTLWRAAMIAFHFGRKYAPAQSGRWRCPSALQAQQPRGTSKSGRMQWPSPDVCSAMGELFIGYANRGARWLTPARTCIDWLLAERERRFVPSGPPGSERIKDSGAHRSRYPAIIDAPNPRTQSTGGGHRGLSVKHSRSEGTLHVGSPEDDVY
ncbi:hypothetical protein MRX96_030652 [Rhipicephalus microplus]